jgi:hypothetical protein
MECEREDRETGALTMDLPCSRPIHHTCYITLFTKVINALAKQERYSPNANNCVRG